MTGASGFLGGYFLRDLIRDPSSEIYGLIRTRNGNTLEDRARSLGLLHPRIHFFPGDLTDQSAIDAVDAGPIDEFWHLASLTEFTEDRRSDLVRSNVLGTKNALQLAKRLGARKFFHISTAYVSGVYDDGPVPEDGVLPSPEFRNPYEETKHEAEKLVHESGLPYIIIRPSTVIGHSQTGEVDSDKMMYGLIKAYHTADRLRRRPNRKSKDADGPQMLFMNADPGVSLNAICVDDVIRAMQAIRERGELSKTYHCTHYQPVIIGRLHDEVMRCLDIKNLTMTLDRPATHPKTGLQAVLDRASRVYEEYITAHDPVFGRNNIDKLLKPSEQPRPLSKEVLARCITWYAKNRLRARQPAAEAV